MFKAEVKIKLKKTILDPQGKTVEHALSTLGYENISGVRIGKLIEMEIDTDNIEKARKVVDEVCRKLLSNPVIEEYSFTVRENEKKG